MTNISFAEQAKQRSLDFFQAYGVENNMEKVLSFFSKESALIGWGSKEIYLDYAAIVATAHQRMTIPFLCSLMTSVRKSLMPQQTSA